MHPFYRWHTDDESNTEDWLTPLVADVARACGCSACVCVCCSAGLRPPIGCRAVAFAALPALPANDSRLSLPLPPPLALVQRAPVSPGPSRPADRQTDRLQPHTQAALNKEKREERRECARSLAAPPLGRKLLLLLLRRKWRPFQACSQRRRLVCVCVSLRLAGLARSAPTAAPIIFGQPASQQTKSGQIVQRTTPLVRCVLKRVHQTPARASTGSQAICNAVMCLHCLKQPLWGLCVNTCIEKHWSFALLREDISI